MDEALDLAEAQLLENLQDELDAEIEEQPGNGSQHEPEAAHDPPPILSIRISHRPSSRQQDKTSSKPSGQPALKAKRKPLLHKKIAATNLAHAAAEGKQETKAEASLQAEDNGDADESKTVSAKPSKGNRRIKTSETAEAEPDQPLAPPPLDPDLVVAIMGSGEVEEKPTKKPAAKKNAAAAANKGKGKENVAALAKRKQQKGQDNDGSQPPPAKKQAKGKGQAKTAQAEKPPKKAVPKQQEAQETTETCNNEQSDEEVAAAAEAEAKPEGKKRGRKAKIRGVARKDSAEKELETSADKAELEEDEAERQDCDWDAHPAEAILALTKHKKLVVKRKGLDLTEYGLVDADLVKRQRLDKDLSSPVSLQMLEEFETWEVDFKKCLRENTIRGALELDDLGKHSPLESCYYLGKMLEDKYPLSKPQQGTDPSTKFPVIALSMVSQRLLNLEKARAFRAEAKVQELLQRIEELEAHIS